jgi:hypothetical protein
MDEGICSDCGGRCGPVWQVTVGTNLQGYTPLFGAPVVVDLWTCQACNTTFERVDGGEWHERAAR